MKWQFTILVASVLSAQLVLAQSSATTTTTTAAEAGAEKTPLKLKGKLQSINWSGRLKDTQSPDGERYRTRFEYELGVKHDNGWGVAGNGRYQASYTGKTSKDVKGVLDPSVKISHPVYKGERLSVSGMLRQYFPVSDKSTSDGVLKYHTAYYNMVEYDLGGKWTVENVVGPRYISQSRYEDNDTKFYTENWTDFVYNSSEKLKVGAGNFAQVSVPHNARTGVSNEIYPFVKFYPVSNFEISALIYVPVLAEGPIDPNSVSTANMKAELSLKASL